MKKKDQVFKTQKTSGSFTFNEEVAEVFDDMLKRSIPFYDEIHKIILDILDRTYTEDGMIYDLGCSTGTTIALMSKFLTSKGFNPSFCGLDNSKPMIEKATEKLKKKKIKNTTLLCEDILTYDYQKSKMIVMNYTLQFIKKEYRSTFLKKLYQSLEPGGVFIYAEKIKCQKTSVDHLFTDLYYDFKRRNGYSEMEIASKREALENVLIPLTPEKQLELMDEAGFKKREILFRWYNFACFIGIK